MIGYSYNDTIDAPKMIYTSLMYNTDMTRVKLWHQDFEYASKDLLNELQYIYNVTLNERILFVTK